MRILHTIPDEGWAGREERILETALWQVEHGHEVSIAAPKGSGLHSYGAAHGLTLLDFPIHPTAATIENICGTFHADVIDAHGTRDSIAAAHAALSVPIIHTRHCLLREEDLTAHKRIAWSRLDHIITVADAIKKELIENGVVYSRYLSVVGEWVVPQFFQSPNSEQIEKMCSELGISSKSPVIAMVALPRKEKGFEVLLQAAAQVCKQVPDLQILIVGGATSILDTDCLTFSEMQSLVQNLGLSKNVIITDFREDVSLLMRCAKLLVVPSFREAQSRVIPQAFASGLPVVASTVGGIPELIKNEITGWLVPSNEPAKLAERLIACLNEPQLQNEIALRAKQFAAEKLDLESKMHQTINIYELARQRHSGGSITLKSSSVQSQFQSTISKSPFAGLHVMLVVAHPDDETIGAGIAISQASRVTLVHVTDGAESNQRAIAKGFASRADYARARAEELRHALAIAEVNVDFVHLDIRDRCAPFHMVDVALSLRKLMLSTTPDVILTHAFEGAHGDHDATAFAVHMAHRSLNSTIPLYEMTGYHSASGADVYGAFIENDELKQITFVLSEQEQAKKKEMLSAFISQRNIIPCFPTVSESFRLAPQYDFSKRPHDGQLYYERHKDKLTWRTWCALVQHAGQILSKKLSGQLSLHWFLHTAIKLKHLSGFDQSIKEYTKQFSDSIRTKLNNAIKDDFIVTNANIPIDKSMQIILDRLVEKINNAPIDSVPADNIYMEELFEPSLYSEILHHLPADGHYDYIEHPDALMSDGRITRKLLDLTNETINRIDPSRRSFWLRMKAILTSEQLLQAVLNKFSKSIEGRFGKYCPHMLLVPVFYRDYPGYRINIHPDAPGKIATMQFYLPADESQIHLGTTFHAKNGDQFHEHKTNPFKPNSAYAFIRTDSSWHSVKEVGAHEKIRNSLALTVYIEGQHFKSQARQQSLLQQLVQYGKQILLSPNNFRAKENLPAHANEVISGEIEYHSLFDSKWYLSRNSDVAKSGINPLVHYVESGANEKRDPNPLFDSKWYLNQYSDVAKSGLNPAAHYLFKGAKEGRNPNPLFDGKWYLSQYPDVAKSRMNPLAHYLFEGAKEGRNPNPLFDSNWYLNQYPDVAVSQMNPLAHYLLHGANEGRDPSPLFSGQLYLTQCPDVAAIGMNPLIHYVQYGRYETRMANIQLKKLTGPISHKYTANRLKEFAEIKAQGLCLPENIATDITFKTNFANPDVSIIVPVCGQLKETLQCLWALSKQHSFYTYEVIAIDDHSSKETEAVLTNIAGLQYRRAETIHNFVSSCNWGAKLASGRYLVFVHNDTEVLPGWLTELINTFEKHSDAGLVGSKLLHADGQLRNEKSTIYGDSFGLNYRDNGDPDRPEYNYVRKLDCCPGTAIAIKKETFITLQGFNEKQPINGSLDKDFIAQINLLGLNALYQPFACCIWNDSVHNGNTDGLAPTANEAVNQKTKLKALFIDADMPMSERDARIWSIHNLFEFLSRQGYESTFIPENLQHAGFYTYQLQKLGIECWYKPYVDSLELFLREIAQDYDVICLFHAHTFEKYGELLKKLFPSAQIILSFDQSSQFN